MAVHILRNHLALRKPCYAATSQHAGVLNCAAKHGFCDVTRWRNMWTITLSAKCDVIARHTRSSSSAEWWEAGRSHGGVFCRQAMVLHWDVDSIVPDSRIRFSGCTAGSVTRLVKCGCIYLVKRNRYLTENTKVYKNPSTEVYPCYTFVKVYKCAFAPLLLWWFYANYTSTEVYPILYFLKAYKYTFVFSVLCFGSSTCSCMHNSSQFYAWENSKKCPQLRKNLSAKPKV